MKSTIRNNRFYNANTPVSGFRMLMAALLIFGSAIAPLAQAPTQKQGQTGLVQTSLPTGQLIPTGLTNVGTKFREFNVNITPSSLVVWDGRSFVSGTGTIRVTGNLSVTGGCCARTEVNLVRRAGIIYNIMKTQTYEFCGSQTVNITDTLDASEDDAEFSVQVRNLDAWNKVTIGGSIRLTYPTADKILTAQPNIPIDLTRGVDVSRTFTLSPNTAGSVKVEIRWSGGASLQAKLFKPGQPFGATYNGVLSQTNSSGAMDLVYDIQPADIIPGAQWAVNVLNNSSSSITATGITFRVIYTVEQ